jgi:hypothetical protein
MGNRYRKLDDRRSRISCSPEPEMGSLPDTNRNRDQATWTRSSDSNPDAFLP